MKQPDNHNQQQLKRLPLFPLPQLVFFPDTLLPLHIFEPRYLTLMEWCLENEWLFAIPTITPGYEREQLGSPPIEPIAGIGKIIQHQKTEDGCYNVVIEGLFKAKIEPIIGTDTPYRLAMATILEDIYPEDTGEIENQFSNLRIILNALKMVWVDAPKGLIDWLLSAESPAVLSNRISSTLFENTDAQSELLQCLDVSQRLNTGLERVIELLSIASEGTKNRH